MMGMHELSYGYAFGWRASKPLTFADKVDLILTEANSKFDRIMPDLATERDLLACRPGGIITFSNIFGFDL